MAFVSSSHQHSLDYYENKLQVCVVGLGRAGNFHLNSLSRLVDRTQVRWVVDVDEAKTDKVSKIFNCKGTSKLEEALEDDAVDLVIIASTTHLHCDQILKAFKAGKAVLTEKPISHDPAELQQVLDMARDNKIPFHVGFQRRYDANFIAAKNQVESGAVGAPRVLLVTSRDNPEPPMEYLRISGGIFHDMLCHDFDMIYFLTGQLPESVYSVGHCYNPEIAKMDDIDTVMVTLKYPSGMLATVNSSRIATYGYDQRFELFGEKGSVTVENNPDCNVTLATEGGFVTPPLKHSFPQRYPETYMSELASFVDQVREKRPMKEQDMEWLINLERITTASELSFKLSRPVLLSELDSLRSSS